MPSKPRDRSVSGELEGDDSDPESPNGLGDDDQHDEPSSSTAGKPGRKKNPNSQAARRDQNRIAQREFRLRKQQRIRDLEASVEILSGGKDEALTHLRKIMKDLMQENQVLRNLLRSLSSFIGDGAGGVLPKMGWDINDFNNFINRSETDTAWESYQRHKRDEPTNGNKRSADDDVNGRNKRARSSTDLSGTEDPYPLLVPMNAAVPPLPANGLYPPSRTDAATFMSDLMRGGAGGSAMFVPPTTSSTPFAPANTASIGGTQHQSFSSTYLSPVNLNVDTGVPNVSMINNPVPNSGLTPNGPTATQPQSRDDDQDPKRVEAYKLIQYHLDNYKRNNQYCLPSSLRPTLVQRTVPHESVIDNILHPELRDRMILLRGRFDLIDCLHDYRTAVTIHGDDVLAHSNWEISDSWLQRYKYLVDKNTLTVVNRWRRERGDIELSPAEYSATEPPV